MARYDDPGPAARMANGVPAPAPSEDPLAALRQRKSALDERETALFRESFKILFMGHYDLVWRVLWRRGARPPVIEELAQQVFMTFYAAVVAGGFPESIPAKLASMASGLARNGARRERHNPMISGPPSSTSERPESAPEMERVLDQRDLGSRLLPALTPGERDAVEAVILDEETQGDAADRLGIARTTLASRLVTAKRRMADLTMFVPPSQRGPV